jgi:hypothetical protein
LALLSLEVVVSESIIIRIQNCLFYLYKTIGVVDLNSILQLKINTLTSEEKIILLFFSNQFKNII